MDRQPHKEVTGIQLLGFDISMYSASGTGGELVPAGLSHCRDIMSHESWLVCDGDKERGTLLAAFWLTSGGTVK
jgi:hypothetical protein